MKRPTLIVLIAAIALVFVSQVLPLLASGLGGGAARRIRNGDVNGDGIRDLSDVIYHARNLFSGGPDPVEEDEAAPPAGLLAEIQASAERILSNLPREDLVSQLPPRARKYLSHFHKLVSTAATAAPSWTAAQVQQYAGALNAVLVAWPVFQSLICQIRPDLCIDWDCMDRCADEADVCLNGCDGLTGFDYMQCFLECNDRLAECMLHCGH